MTPLEKAARTLLESMEGVHLAGTPEQNAAIVAAHFALWCKVHQIEHVRDLRAKQKAKREAKS